MTLSGSSAQLLRDGCEASQERGHNLAVVSVPLFERCEHH